MIIDLAAPQSIIRFDAELRVVTLKPGVTQGMLAEFLDAGNHPYLMPVTSARPKRRPVWQCAVARIWRDPSRGEHFGVVTDLEAALTNGSMYRTNALYKSFHSIPAAWMTYLKTLAPTILRYRL